MERGIMKIVWEEKDIKEGRRFRNQTDQEVWMIGYVCPAKKYTVINLQDGSVNGLLVTQQEVADLLNRNECYPLELLDESWRNYPETP